MIGVAAMGRGSWARRFARPLAAGWNAGDSERTDAGQVGTASEVAAEHGGRPRRADEAEEWPSGWFPAPFGPTGPPRNRHGKETALTAAR